MSLPQQTTPPSPALMHSTSVPQVSHWNRFPSWLDTIYLRSFDWLRTGSLLLLHRLVAAAQAAFAALGDDHLRAALRALISLAHLVRHWLSVLPDYAAVRRPRACGARLPAGRNIAQASGARQQRPLSPVTSRRIGRPCGYGALLPDDRARHATGGDPAT